MSVKTVSSQADAANPLGYEKEGKLLVGFAIPCIISMLVTSLYNIVDQIFIGQAGQCCHQHCVSSLNRLHSHCTAARYRQCDEFQSPAGCRQ